MNRRTTISMLSVTWLGSVLAGGSMALAQEYGITTFQYPGASYINPFSISSGGLVAGTTQIGTTFRGFTFDGVSFQLIDVPYGTGAAAFFMNDAGDAAGRYHLSRQINSHGFVRFNGVITPFDVAGCYETQPSGINNTRQVAGTCVLTTTRRRIGFVRQENGQVSTFQVPGASDTYANGISDTGTVVGAYTDAQDQRHGFVFDGIAFTTLDAPGATVTTLSAISPSSTFIVGNYYGGWGGAHDFIYDGDSFVIVDLAGGPNGVNDSGVIVGNALSTTGGFRGYIATPQ